MSHDDSSSKEGHPEQPEEPVDATMEISLADVFNIKREDTRERDPLPPASAAHDAPRTIPMHAIESSLDESTDPEEDRIMEINELDFELLEEDTDPSIHAPKLATLSSSYEPDEQDETIGSTSIYQPDEALLAAARRGWEESWEEPAAHTWQPEASPHEYDATGHFEIPAALLTQATGASGADEQNLRVTAELSSPYIAALTLETQGTIDEEGRIILSPETWAMGPLRAGMKVHLRIDIIDS